MSEQHQIPFIYTEYTAVTELCNEDQLLVRKAIEARERAWSPYSGFQVGASVMMEDSTIIEGNNQENIAYPSGLCAERTALFYAGSHYPDKKIIKMAISGGKGPDLTHQPLTPCGACRQVMLEYETRQNHPIELIMVGKDKIYKISHISQLLPFSFNHL